MISIQTVWQSGSWLTVPGNWQQQLHISHLDFSHSNTTSNLPAPLPSILNLAPESINNAAVDSIRWLTLLRKVVVSCYLFLGATRGEAVDIGQIYYWKARDDHKLCETTISRFTLNTCSSSYIACKRNIISAVIITNNNNNNIIINLNRLLYALSTLYPTTVHPTSFASGIRNRVFYSLNNKLLDCVIKATIALCTSKITK
jgi:hypothetical protein